MDLIKKVNQIRSSKMNIFQKFARICDTTASYLICHCHKTDDLQIKYPSVQSSIIILNDEKMMKEYRLQLPSAKNCFHFKPKSYAGTDRKFQSIRQTKKYNIYRDNFLKDDKYKNFFVFKFIRTEKNQTAGIY